MQQIDLTHAPAPAAGFAPVTPVGETPVLSLVPPIVSGEQILHPDPIDTRALEQRPLPTNAQIPVAPVRRRRPVTPLITLPIGSPIEAALQVAPVLPSQSVGQPQIVPTPAAYGVVPTTFPFQAAPVFNAMPQQPFMQLPMQMSMPMQMYVAYVTLMPQAMPMPQQMVAQAPQAMPTPQQQVWQPQVYGYAQAPPQASTESPVWGTPWSPHP